MSASPPSSEGRAVRALAPAKVNLTLEVLGRRADGYHEIRTWMLAVDLCDVVEVRRTRTGTVRLRLEGPHASADVPSDEKNLAWRAAMLALEAGRSRGRAGPDAGLDVRLEKQIPSQSGLGGASSDAAAVLLAAQSALDFELPLDAASVALVTLGSDCAYFLRAAATGFALCTGRGERVESHDSVGHDWNVAILTPQVRCSTESVYRAVSTPLRPPQPTHRLPQSWSAVGATAARSFLFNQLEEAALKAAPPLRAWREVLDECDASHFRMSGSGSSFFGVFDDCVEAAATLERVRARAESRGLGVRGHWTTRPKRAAAGLAC